MEIFFADDSIQKGIREGMGRLVAVGGIFVEESFLKPLSEKIDTVATCFGIPKDTEIKWSPDKTSWIHRNLVGDKRTECYRQIFQACKEYDVRALVVVWDTGRTTLEGQAAFDKCLDFLFERITVHLEKRNHLGLIVADKPAGSRREEDDFLVSFLERIQSGTDFVPPKGIPLNVLTTPSHLIRQLQVADLVTGISTALVAGQLKYTEPLLNEVKSLFIRNHYGFIGGTGLKLFPDSLINLYYWVLNEEIYLRVSNMSMVKLPADRYPYYTNGFSI